MSSDPETPRLSTWAEIAAYIGRDVRTAKRYEAERGLPVRRLPGSRSTVFALASDLDAWRAGARSEPEPLYASAPTAVATAPVEPAPPPPRTWRARIADRRGVWLGAGLLLALAAGSAVALRPSASERPPSPDVAALYRQGVFAWSRRTPDGLAGAIDAFTQAVVRDPGYAPAYAGLADAYDLAPEFGRLPPAQAYPRAKSAAERALALDPSSAAAHRALAFVEFWWEGRVAPAMAEFRRAVKLDPRSAQTHHWYANALAARGDPRALDEYDLAASLGPSSHVMADRAWALVTLGRPAEALSALDDLARLDPSVPSEDVTYAAAAHRLGRESDMLDALRRAALARGDTEDVGVIAHIRADYAKGGRPALLQALADREEARLAQGRSGPVDAAQAEAERGRDAAALALLQRAKAEHDPAMLSLAINPYFVRLHRDPRFRILAS